MIDTFNLEAEIKRLKERKLNDNYNIKDKITYCINDLLNVFIELENYRKNNKPN